MNLIGSVIQRSVGSPKNTLSIPTHETAFTAFAKALPEFNHYLIYGPNLKTWDNRFRELPSNCFLLKDGVIPLELNFDVILSQNHADQYQILAPIARQYNVPLITVTHTARYPSMSKNYVRQVKSCVGDVNVFISDWSRHDWGWDDSENAITIEHAIDCEEFKPAEDLRRGNYILSVCNQFNRQVRWEPCGFPLWNEVILPFTPNGLPWKHLGADCDDFADAAENLNDLIENYQNASIFINTSKISPIPMSLLEAAACGCAIVSTNTCAIPSIFTDGKDAVLSNDPKVLRDACIYYLNFPEKARQMGEAARQTVMKKCDPVRFRNDWVKVFNKLGIL